MKQVLCVIGTRPEGIKMAPVISALKKASDRFVTHVCLTGQHREMLAPILDLFQIVPDFNLGVMQPNQDLSDLLAVLLQRLKPVVREVDPSWIMAQGDTTTVLATALVAYHERCRFAHVEAGLRTGNKFSPFPEEGNRRLADSLADLFFAPTQRARNALLSEGIPSDKVHVTGNTVVDALQYIASLPFLWNQSPLKDLPRQKIVLVTAHRRESFGDAFRHLCMAIHDLACAFESDGYHFVYPVHLNPNVQQPVRSILSGLPNVHLIEPLDYQSLVQLMMASTLILTDSGGIQEEAPSFGVPVLVLRDTTERPEALEAGVAKLVGTERETIVREAIPLLADPKVAEIMKKRENPFGDGKAANRIIEILGKQSY